MFFDAAAVPDQDEQAEVVGTERILGAECKIYSSTHDDAQNGPVRGEVWCTPDGQCLRVLVESKTWTWLIDTVSLQRNVVVTDRDLGLPDK